jgi:hypothetical protein
MIRHLPKMKEDEVVLSVREARVVWEAAEDCGYPFGSQPRLMFADPVSHG